jgi:hypothetical protein
MKADLLAIKGTWREVADSARTTVHKEAGEGEPSSRWKRRMLLSEHSPIRQLFVRALWSDLKYWVSVHLVRHKIGIEHWVRTQRSDRTGVDRDALAQGSPVEHEILADAQAIITISRRRLCMQASPETREAWKALVEAVGLKEPELAAVCVPDCVYRGWCYEYQSCGYHKTEAFKQRLEAYREGINP